MMLLQKLFFLSLFVSMIISPNGLRDRFNKLLKNEPSSKDVKLEEKVYEDSAPIEILNNLIEKYHPTRETVQQATSSKSGAIAMVGHMSPFQEVSHNPMASSSPSRGSAMALPMSSSRLEASQNPSDANEKNRLRRRLNEKYKKPKEQERMKEVKVQQSQKHSQKYKIISESEIEKSIPGDELQLMEYDKNLILRITENDGQLQKYETENKDQPILGTAIKKYALYNNEKENPLQRKHDDQLIMVYAFLGDILSDAERVMLGPYEEDRKILYHISTDECERIQSDIDRKSCYELLIALKKHGIAVFAYVLWDLEIEA